MSRIAPLPPWPPFNPLNPSPAFSTTIADRRQITHLRVHVPVQYALRHSADTFWRSESTLSSILPINNLSSVAIFE
jgi:hypothetical protein